MKVGDSVKILVKIENKKILRAKISYKANKSKLYPYDFVAAFTYATYEGGELDDELGFKKSELEVIK